MADRKAQYVVRATQRQASGAAVAFAVATSVDVLGRPIFDDSVTRQVVQGRNVLHINDGSRNSLPTGVYRVGGQGNPLQALELQAVPGDVVRVTCTPEDLPEQAGTEWMLLDDQSFILVNTPTAARLNVRLDELEGRVPLPPPVPEPLQPEGA